MFTPEQYAQRIAECGVVRDVGEAKAASDHYPLLAVLDD
jgi:endonuclease/exonuclease/phosphatase family metal-dependent hydrolase